MKNILTPLDGTETAEAALPWARSAATRSGAAIRLLSVLEQPGDGNGHLEKLEGYLQAHKDGLWAHGLAAEAEVALGSAALRILSRAEEADLTVMTYGNSRWVFGSVLDRVLQKMTRPLVLVRTNSKESAEYPPPAKILVPLDTPAYSSRVLPIAESIAKALGATMTLCHVVRPVGEYYAEGLLDDARRFVGSVAEHVQRQGIGVETVVAVGEAHLEIRRIAGRTGAGIIAMATRGRDRLENRIMGSVSNAVVQSTHLPCLLIRPSEA